MNSAPGEQQNAAVSFDSRQLARQPWVAALVLAVWLACTAWMRPLMLPDEGRYVSVAWHMMTSGNWLTPMLNGLPFFHKPPLFYWMSAAAMSTLGVNEFAARLPSLLAAWVAGMGLYFFVRHWRDERFARLSLVALALQPMYFCGAQFANLDMLVAGLITVTVLALAHAQLCRELGLRFRRTLALAYALAALGILAKGLIGFVLPGLVIAVWLALRGRWRAILGLLWWPGLLLFGVVMAPWFVLEGREFPGFMHYFFVVQHFERFAGSGFNNVQPFWFYPAVLALFGLPWLYWYVRHLRHVRDAVLGRFAAPRVAHDPIDLLMWAWPAVIVLFFSLPQSKLIGYVLPAVPPLAFWAAAAFATRREPTLRERTYWRASAAVAIALSLLAVFTFTFKPIHTARQIARVLAVERNPSEPVLMVGAFAYDVPIYADLRAPVPVVDDWDPDKIKRHDDWHKELADAGSFDPVRSAALLVSPQRALVLLCGAPGAWIVTQQDPAKLFEGIADRAQMAEEGPWRLWHLVPGKSGSINCVKDGQHVAPAKPSNRVQQDVTRR